MPHGSETLQLDQVRHRVRPRREAALGHPLLALVLGVRVNILELAGIAALIVLGIGAVLWAAGVLKFIVTTKDE